jgi:hypothetical protein
VTISPTSPLARLAQIASASAQSGVNQRIQLINNALVNQLNKKIAVMKAAAQNPAIPGLEAQVSALGTQQTAYNTAASQSSNNALVLADVSLRLGTLAAAAQNGDAATFDQNLSGIVTDIGILQPTSFAPGLQSDGIAALQFSGIGIQSSANYNLGTAAGQAQAGSDVTAAQSLIQSITGVATTNQAIADSAIQAIQAQITGLNSQISNDQNSVLSSDAAQIAKLKQQEQEQFHVIELSMGNVGETSSMLASFETSGSTAPPPGSIVSLLVNENTPTEPTLSVANVAPPTISTSV